MLDELENGLVERDEKRRQIEGPFILVFRELIKLKEIKTNFENHRKKYFLLFPGLKGNETLSDNIVKGYSQQRSLLRRSTEQGKRNENTKVTT